MKTTKVTQKNIKRISKSVEMDLQKSLSIFSGSQGNQFAYDTKREVGNVFATIYITPTRKKNAYITMAAIQRVDEFCEASEWKDILFSGVEICNSYDKESKCYIPLPCISVSIKIEYDEQQG